VISGLATHVLIEQATASVDDECPSLLQGIALRAGLAEALTESGHPVQHHARPQGAGQAVAKTSPLVALARGVGVKSKRKPLRIPEGTGLLHAAVAHNHEIGPALAKLINEVAQLRDLLLAEHSPIVANEHQHDRLVLPEIAQLDFAPLEV
jgi:hypothetical protein